MGSNIDKKTHMFWNKMALAAGAFLAYFGYINLDTVELAWIVMVIGIATVVVDSWFLKNV